MFLGHVFLLICSNLLVNAFELTLVHNNDFHAHYDPMNAHGNDCNDKLEAEGKCFGGVARLAAKIKELRSGRNNVLVLNGGDNVVGTIYYSLFKWNITAEFLNYINYDAISLGNHEFDYGWSQLRGFLRNISATPVVCSNIEIIDQELPSNLYKSLVTVIDGRKVGVIGYITPTTVNVSSPGKSVIFQDEIESIRKEVEVLKKSQVDIIIALGHSGFAKDKEIAQEIPDLDVVVGGHSNTFLYTGVNPSVENIEGPYPVVVNHPDGRRTLVVSAYAYGKYLGVLNLFFDEKGWINDFKGKVLLLDKKTKEDEGAKQLLKKYKKDLATQLGITVGKTAVFLNGHRDQCRRKECNMGNLVTDALVHSHVTSGANKRSDSGWTLFPIAILPGGAIRSSIDEKATEGNISYTSILTVLPFGNVINGMRLTGKQLKEVFEHSASELDYGSKPVDGNFLQVSGIKVVYNNSKPLGSRVISLQARCGPTCRIPMYEEVNDEEVYNVLLVNYQQDGGNGYHMLKREDFKRVNIGTPEIEAVKIYLEKTKLVTIGIEERSVVLGKSSPSSANLKSVSGVICCWLAMMVIKTLLQ